MASTVPEKSQPLHNFNLPHLKWNKDGHSSGHHQRRRSIKSPSRRPSTSASPLRHSPLRDSVSATPPRLQSPLRDSAALSSRDSPVHGDYLTKQSPAREESSKPSLIREWLKHSPIGGESEKHSSRRGEAVRNFLSRDLALESEALRNSNGALIEYRRNHSRNSAFDSIKNGVSSSNSELAMEKFEKKSRATEVDAAKTKRSKILIKIPCKNNKLEEENPQEEPLKIEHNDEHDETDEVQEEGKINNNIDEETKTWNLRPRKPIRKSRNVTGGSEKSNVSAVAEKSKAQKPLMNANRSGEKEGNCNGGAGGEKKDKRKLSILISLSKEEIEEDIFSLTGSKPSRRPKKRAKNIQKQVDFVFPGLWLVSITPESYKVSENSLKLEFVLRLG